MMCQHEEIANLLSFYVAGTLTAAERAVVDAHLSACPFCQAEVQTLAEGARVFKEHGLEEIRQHIDPDETVEYCHDRRQLDPFTVRRIERHLQTCRPCTEDLKLVEAMNRELAEKPSRVRTWISALSARLPRWRLGLLIKPAFVATISLLLLAGIVTQNFLTRESVPSFTLTMETMVRGEPAAAQPATVQLTKRQRFFEVDFGFEITIRPGYRYDMEITDPQGKVIVRRPDIKSRDAYGSFQEKLDRALFTSGRYVMVVQEINGATGEVTRTGRFPFEVVAF